MHVKYCNRQEIKRQLYWNDMKKMSWRKEQSTHKNVLT